MTVFKTVWGICCLKQNPSELPFSTNWLGFFLFLNVLLYALIGQFFPKPEVTFLFITHLLVQLGLFWGVMRYYGYTNRWLQSWMAILSTRLFILISTFLIAILFRFSPSLLMFLFGLAAMWFMLVLGHIVRCTLEVPLSKGVLWAIGVDMLSNILVSPFFKEGLDFLGAS